MQGKERWPKEGVWGGKDRGLERYERTPQLEKTNSEKSPKKKGIRGKEKLEPEEGLTILSLHYVVNTEAEQRKEQPKNEIEVRLRPSRKSNNTGVSSGKLRKRGGDIFTLFREVCF